MSESVWTSYDNCHTEGQSKVDTLYIRARHDMFSVILGTSSKIKEPGFFYTVDLCFSVQLLKRIILIRRIKINFLKIGIQSVCIAGRSVAFGSYTGQYGNKVKDGLQEQRVRWSYV